MLKMSGPWFAAKAVSVASWIFVDGYSTRSTVTVGFCAWNSLMNWPSRVSRFLSSWVQNSSLTGPVGCSAFPSANPNAAAARISTSMMPVRRFIRSLLCVMLFRLTVPPQAGAVKRASGLPQQLHPQQAAQCLDLRRGIAVDDEVVLAHDVLGERARPACRARPRGRAAAARAGPTRTPPTSSGVTAFPVATCMAYRSPELVRRARVTLPGLHLRDVQQPFAEVAESARQDRHPAVDHLAGHEVGHAHQHPVVHELVELEVRGDLAR